MKTFKIGKKFFAIFLAVILSCFLIFQFVACASKDKGDPNDTDITKPVDPPPDDNTGEDGGNGEEDGDKDDGNGDDDKDDDNDGDDKDDETIKPTLSYVFSGGNAEEAGYAEGKVTLSSAEAGEYLLYWADDTAALTGYYEVCTLDASDGNAEYDFGYHVAIPVGATKLIVTQAEEKSVEKAIAVFDIPTDKRIDARSKLYSFGSYSDIHIDKQKTYKKSTENWAQALNYAAKKNADFIVTSGDTITNAEGPVEEWDIYRNTIAASDFSGPIWESNGNHDLRGYDNYKEFATSGNYAFVRATGTDSSLANYENNKPYYYVEEKATGDVFIFMALENGYHASDYDEFSAAQMTWLEGLLDTYCGTGVNVYIIEHSPIEGFGAGDRMSNPYYRSMLNTSFVTTRRFKSLLEQYKDVVWMSGHTHIDFSLDYNYSNENGTACHMIHNPSVASTTVADSSDSGLDYKDFAYNSQGYYVEAYGDRIVYYGVDLSGELIYPEYCYVMQGGRNVAPVAKNSEPQATANALADKSLQEAMSEAKVKLNSAKSFASFDQYQALKKLYNMYSLNAPADDGAAVVALDGAHTALEEIINGVDGGTFFFTNTRSWSSVYCYAIAEDGKTNRGKPGAKMVWVAKNDYGQDIYAIRFDGYGKYEKLVFNNGSGEETVEIDISANEKNAFYIKDGTKTDGKYGNIGTYSYACETRLYRECERYQLCYYSKYNGGDKLLHSWNAIDTPFKENGDGTFELTLDLITDDSLSFCIYNYATGQYRCVAASESVTYTDGGTATKNLAAASGSRGKSITINGAKIGSTVKIVFDPAASSVSLTFADIR